MLTEDQLKVVDTILHQMGGHKFIAMTGARQMLADVNTIQFRLPNRKGPKGCINFVVIRLEPSDTYSMTFYYLRGTSQRVVDERRDVYFDSLQEVFTRVTGLETHL